MKHSHKERLDIIIAVLNTVHCVVLFFGYRNWIKQKRQDARRIANDVVDFTRVQQFERVLK